MSNLKSSSLTIAVLCASFALVGCGNLGKKKDSGGGQAPTAGLEAQAGQNAPVNVNGPKEATQAKLLHISSSLSNLSKKAKSAPVQCGDTELLNKASAALAAAALWTEGALRALDETQNNGIEDIATAHRNLRKSCEQSHIARCALEKLFQACPAPNETTSVVLPSLKEVDELRTLSGCD